MAEKDKRDKDVGNIRTEYNNAIGGLNLDNTPNQTVKGKVSYALNANIESFDGNSINYQNELGNEFCLEFPSGYLLVAKHFIPERKKHIFFITNPSDGGSQIGYMDDNDCQYKVLVNSPCLGFSIQHPIHKIVHKITNCSTEIFWADHIARRYLDIDDIPRVLKSGTPLCNPSYTDDLDCNQLKVQPNFSIPSLRVNDVREGGNVFAGTYQFAVQYSDSIGNPYTSYYSITNPTPIADPTITSLNFNYPVGKSIIVNVGNIDISGQFEYFNLAVIKTINDISTPELVGTYFIDNNNKNITYTGQVIKNLNINDIFEKFPYYEIAEDVTAVQDVLIWAKLKSIDRVNYQKIANKITLQWETWRIPASENYSDELNSTNLRGNLRDEVYPYEITFLLDNGKQTDGFHIPGRIMNSTEILTPSIHPSNEDSVYDETVPYWKVYNTATVTGTDSRYTTDSTYKGPYQYGDFAYWESSETYPCNEEVWGDLAGKPIRHHKFPDIAVSPIFETDTSLSLPDISMGAKAIFPIGVKINVNQIRVLIEQSDLTRAEKDSIVGFKILRGDRSTNKSIIAKGMLRNVGKYKREEQDYYFPNYPYNDLRKDPFLSETNNAFSQICETFLIQINSLSPDPDGGAPYAEIEYINCDTNKQARKIYTSIMSEEICSIGKPIRTTGDINISYASYNVWEAVANGINGFSVQWEDINVGLTNEWVNGLSSLRLRAVKGTTPIKVNGTENYNINLENEVFAKTNCSTVSELTPINEDENLSYRQVFNSPETSFGQPFLGSILKLESVMYGKGKAHFVEVKDNAKYKLLTEETQRDALLSSEKLADITDPFDASAMITAYQSYLTIYINGITRRNYAYSFNSIADYNQSIAVPNNEGVKQRKIDIARYLIPAVLNVGDDANLNNYQRESSVFIKTDEEDSPIPFPHESPSVITKGIEERSRFTISEIDNCDKPGKEEGINVASYYASIKNDIPNQWGQIYSYDVVDTGLQVDLKTYQLMYATAFGGDTFISRFAYKSKLPFFIDNRVGAPDDSDIFYDEIGNVAYPKYWHSARSILKDYSATLIGTTFTNIISYKAHNFDCPNSQGGENETDAPGRSYYDGYFYLFAYGIPYFYCESSYNIDLRQAFNNREGDFWPHVSTGIPDDWIQESFVSINQDNTYTYNRTFSKQNKENSFSHLPTDWSNDQCLTNYPFREIHSDPQNTDSDNRLNNWLVYRATSYFDFPQSFGSLISLDGIQNKAILARFENKTLLYNNLLTIDTSNPQSAYLGNPKLFSTPPIDYAETDLGFVGSQHKMLLKIPMGQITVDTKRSQIFLLSGTKAIDLTSADSSVSRWMNENLSFKILRYFPTVNIDNHFNGVGFHGVFDSKYNRIILTKLDFIPLSDNVRYDKTLQYFYVEKNYGSIKIKEKISLFDPIYFCNKSFTISFNFNTNSWISFHSYIPNFYIGENNFFYSGLNNCCSDFEFVVTQNIVSIPGELENAIVTYDECGNEIHTLFEGEACTSPTTSTTTTLLSCVLGAEGIIITPPNPTTTLLSCAFNANGVVVVGPFITTSTTSTTIFTPTTTIPPVVCAIDIFYNPSGIPSPIGWINESDACDGIGQLLVVYVIGPFCPGDIYQVYNEGKTLYTDASYTTPLNGNNSWMKTEATANEGQVFLVSTTGQILQFNSVSCDGTPTTSTSSSSTSSTTSSTSSSTTSSSTTLMPPFTTTTSTAVPVDCDLEGIVYEVDCDLDGTGIIIVPPTPSPCQRPSGLNSYGLGIGYTITESSEFVSTTGSQEEACAGIGWIDSVICNINSFSVNYIIAEAQNLLVGTTVFAGGGDDCSVIDDGWYFTNESLTTNFVYHIVSGVIVEIVICGSTTTTSTTFECTTTSSTTLYPPSTTTSTTSGTTTTSTTTCTRPGGLLQGTLIGSWTIPSYGTDVIYLMSVSDACNSFYTFTGIPLEEDSATGSWSVEFASMNVSEKVWRNCGATNCDTIPNGNYWYNATLACTNPIENIHSVPSVQIITVSSGVITAINTCSPSTTSTSTTGLTTTTTTTTTTSP